MGAASRERWRDPVYREKMSAIGKARWQDPEYRERLSEASRARCASPDYKAHLGSISKARWEDPAYRERMAALTRARWEDPLMRARMTRKRAVPVVELPARGSTVRLLGKVGKAAAGTVVGRNMISQMVLVRILPPHPWESATLQWIALGDLAETSPS